MRHIKLFDLFVTFIAVGMMFFASTAMADDVFGNIANAGTELFRNVRMLIFIAGGFGLLVLAALAIFGKVKWWWFAALAFGLLIVALAGMIVEWVVNTANPDALGDSSSYLDNM